MRLGGFSGRLLPIGMALVVGVGLGVVVVAPILDGRQAAAGGIGPTGSDSAASPPVEESTAPASPGRQGASQAAGTLKASRPPASPALAVGVTAAAEGVVPILYYHRVQGLPAGFGGWSRRSQDQFLVDDTLPVAFAAQLDWLIAHGYTTILPRDLAAHWDKGTALPKRPVILTFDDGFSDWRSFVLPQLVKRGMVAEFYVVIANVNRAISWADVRVISKAGMGIGAHDVQHFQLAGGGVATSSAATMRYQVGEAKRLIEQNVGVTVDSMAYVGGGYNATLVRIVQEAGYTTARAIERGVRQTPEARYHLRVSRIGWRDDVVDMYRGTLVKGLPTFAVRVSGQNPG